MNVKCLGQNALNYVQRFHISNNLFAPITLNTWMWKPLTSKRANKRETIYRLDVGLELLLLHNDIIGKFYMCRTIITL